MEANDLFQDDIFDLMLEILDKSQMICRFHLYSDFIINLEFVDILDTFYYLIN